MSRTGQVDPDDPRTTKLNALPVFASCIECARATTMGKFDALFALFDDHDLGALSAKQLRSLLLWSLTAFCQTSNVDIPGALDTEVAAWLGASPLCCFDSISRHDLKTWAMQAPEALVVLSTYGSTDRLEMQARVCSLLGLEVS